MSLYLLFDIGNTRLKWAAVESTQNPSDRNKKLWSYSGSISSKSLQSPAHCAELADYIAKTIPKPAAIGFCCVAGAAAINKLKTLFPQWEDVSWKQFSGNSQYKGMRTLYEDPTKLGADRWAAVIGARALSNTNTLIINAGTATTIDLLGGNGVHYGGWILPGLSLMLDSLQSNTAQLPLAMKVNDSTPSLAFGLNTNNAIAEGCEAAQVGAILRALQLAKGMHHPIGNICLDGGNSKVLAVELKKLTDPLLPLVDTTENLVLRGIWAWLLQNP